MNFLLDKKRIGLVGLGLMGSGMARNLIASGWDLFVYDIDPQKVEAVVSWGGRAVKNPEKFSEQVNTLLLSLPNSHVVEEVVRKDLKLLDSPVKSLILIDTTTADPLMSEELSLALKEKGIDMLDATISGTSRMCAEREITFMVGGEERIFRECEAIFSAMGKTIFYLGKNGSGALMKLIVNLVLGLNRMVLAEGLSLGKKAGIDQEKLLQVLRESAAYSKAMDMKGRKMIEKDFLPPEGKLAFHLKDVSLILNLGKRLDAPLFLSSFHAQALTSIVARGKGEWDNAAIVSFYNEMMGMSEDD
jgi:3-hydroxyisobutyrate dehydrogenase-like beta-hydroxyacid dehydrogenase